MRKYLKSALALIAILCLVWAFIHAGRDAARTWPDSPLILLVSLLLYLGHYAIQAVGWHLILRGLEQPVTLPQSVRMWYSSLMARWIPGPFLYSVARLYLAKEYGLSAPAVGFAVLLELCYILAGAISVAIAFSTTLFSRLLSHSAATMGPIISFAVVIGLAAMVMRPSFLRSIFHVKWVQKLAGKFSKSEIDWDHLPTMSTKASFGLVLYFMLFWLYSGAMFWVMATAFMKIEPSQGPIVIAAFPASWVIGFLAILTPAGLGVREAAMYFMLSPSMEPGQATILAIWSRILMLVAEVMSVGITLLATRKIRPAAHLELDATQSNS